MEKGETQDACLDSRQATNLYELALAIGGSLDMDSMLHRALGAFVRQFGCASGAIYLASPDILPDEPAVALPDERQSNGAMRLTAALLPKQMTREQWVAFCDGLPHAGADEKHGRFCLLPVGKQGLLVLAGADSQLDKATVTALLPLTQRLDEALHACLTYEMLASAHRTALLESNILRTVLEATPTVLLAIDNEGRSILSEGRGLAALGSEPGEMVGQSVFDLFRHAPELLDNVRAALAGEQRRLTLQLNNRNWDVTYEPLFEETGMVTCVVGVAHDVTERTTALDSLRAVLETVGEGILSLDAAGCMVLVNPELQRIFDYDAQELLGRPIALLLPALGAQASAPAPSEAPWRAGLGQRCEMEGLRKDGSPFPVEVCINEIIAGGEVGYTGSVRDISERREYERLRDEFVSTVSHELRTPLASIMGWTETLLTEHPGPINESQRRFLNIVYGSSQRLNRLIEEILTVSRIQRGTLRIHSEQFQPAQVLAAVRESAVPAAGRQGILLEIEDRWPAQERVLGDAQLLEQVITNLVSNAVKFSRSGSTVSVRSQPSASGWRVEVQDQGMGMAAAELPKLFQRFVRGSNAKAAHIQGAGLGLFVSKAIVEAHGGEIYLTSREGEGTTAWFELPPRRPNGSKDMLDAE